MAITYPLALPSSAFIESSFYLDRNEQDTSDLFSRSPQTVNIGAGTNDRWKGLYRTKPLSLAELQQWRGFFDALQGTVGTFLISNPDYKPATGLSSNPTVNGGSQTGRSLNITGLTANLSMGDEFVVNGEYKRLTQDVSPSSGNATLDFESILRASPANGATVNFLTPQITVRLQQARDPITTGYTSLPVTFAWEEAV